MQCPLHDGELVETSETSDSGVTFPYYHCPTCQSLWMDSISGNYLPISVDRSVQSRDVPRPNPTCPVCRDPLERVFQESVPQGVIAYQCSKTHGYFFPVGEYTAFREAQQAKLQYHRLWGIPLPNLRSVLLGSLIVFLAIGVGVTVFETRKNRDIRSSAQHFVRYHAETVVPETRSVVISVTTSIPATVTLHLDAMDIVRSMESDDQLTHRIAIDHLEAGKYEYTLSAMIGPDMMRSDPYSFVIP